MSMAKSPQMAEPHPDPASIPATPELSAKMFTYRLIPLWVFLLSFGLLSVWEFGVKGSAATGERLQAVFLLSLLFALFIGGTVGIRYWNPLPPKK